MFKRTLPLNQGLSYVVWKGDVAAVRRAIAMGADVNYRPSDSRRLRPSEPPPDDDDAPVLHRAAASADAAIVRVLLELGANAHATDLRGRTPLHWAAREGNAGVVRLLVERGLAVDARDGGRQTPLYAAAEAGHVEVMRELVDLGADVDARALNDSAPLHAAAICGRLNAVTFLLSAGATLLARTAATLHRAAFGGHVQVIALLVEKGISVDDKDGGGATAFSSAFSMRDASKALLTARELVRLGGTMDIEAEGTLQSAAGEDALETMRVCLDHWARNLAENKALETIPVEAYQRGVGAVRTYLQDLETSTSAVYRHKVCVVGPSTWGKTSLIKSLTREASTLETVDTRTVGIDLFSWTFEMPCEPATHEVTFWDFAGQDIYHTAHTLFFSQRTLFIVVVDLAAYASVLATANERVTVAEARLDAFVAANVIHWLRLIFARQPEATVVFVATKKDRVDPEAVREILADLAIRLRKWARNLDTHSVSCFDLSDRLLRALSECLPTTSADIESISALQDYLRQSILKSQQGFLMPDKFSRVLDSVSKARGSIENLYAEECDIIMRMLHDLGDVLWFDCSDDSTSELSHHTILAPDLVIEFVREAINHELFELNDLAADVSPQEKQEMDAASVRRREVFAMLRERPEFPQWAQRIREFGQVDHELLALLSLWSDLCGEYHSARRVEALKALLQAFGLAYPALQTRMEAYSDLVVPAYWKMQEDAVVSSGPDAVLRRVADDLQCLAPLHHSLHTPFAKCAAIERMVEEFPGLGPDRFAGSSQLNELLSESDGQAGASSALDKQRQKDLEWLSAKTWRRKGEFPRLHLSDVDSALALHVQVDQSEIPAASEQWSDWELMHPDTASSVSLKSVHMFSKQNWESLSVTFTKAPVIPKLRECSLRVSIYKKKSAINRLLRREYR
ncbi:hypothetical protein P43SY_001366 [Pythium insidiosum]|uniref:Roc domain-containing protein n=1 Tax=Pythium insidiosum TaxID=114742 RepID=A0AAD5LNV0_PYTIN|nr:hypothetical protein P43SY_001366 [Pythium insidiosum]